MALKTIADTEHNLDSLRKSMEEYLVYQESIPLPIPIQKTIKLNNCICNLFKCLPSPLCLSVEVRGKRLNLALTLKQFSESEPSQMSSLLLSTAESLVDIEEYRKYMHDRVQTRSLGVLSTSGKSEIGGNGNGNIGASNVNGTLKDVCKRIKDDVKTRDAAIERHRKSHLLSHTSSSSDQPRPTELEYLDKALTENMTGLHAKKYADVVQTTVFECVYSEMQFHAKSLEILTHLQNRLFAPSQNSNTNNSQIGDGNGNGGGVEDDLKEIRERLTVNMRPVSTYNANSASSAKTSTPQL